MYSCLPKPARPLALLLCGLLALPAPAALAQSADFTSAISDTTRPLTLKVKDLDGTWRQLFISKVGGVDRAALLGAREGSPTLDQYFTHGETTVIGGETYLVAYRFALKISYLVAFPNALKTFDPTPDIANTTPLITPDTTLTLSLINVRQIVSLEGIQPFVPVSAATAEAEAVKNAQEQSVRNLKQIGLGMIQYVQDFDEQFPPMQSTALAKKAIYPYVKSEAVFQSPVTHEPYRPNTSLSYHSIAEIIAPSSMVAYYEASAASDGLRAVLFADGHVTRLPDAEWRRLLAASHLPAAKR